MEADSSETDPIELPDRVVALLGNVADPHEVELVPDPGAGWSARGISVLVSRPERRADLSIAVEAIVPLRGLVLDWPNPLPDGAAVLGDAWERSYGELGWRSAERAGVLPWSWIGRAVTGAALRGRGVRVRPNAFCGWEVRADRMLLHLDLDNGGDAVVLDGRRLHVATVTGVRPVSGTSPRPFALQSALAARMCSDPLRSPGPVVGANNWYYAYGHGFDDDAVVGDAARVSELAGDHPVRPFGVVDAGWSPGGGAPGGPWTGGIPGLFDDLPGLTARIREVGVRPGIWMRPIARSFDVDERLLRDGPRPADEQPLDISRPEVVELVRTDLARIATWGFELIKHDFSTFDAFGRWGSQMQPGAITEPGWHFADRSRTNAELLNRLYDTILDGAGPALVLGCNTVGHLAAGRVHVNRTGDDTSGRDWARTRQMGVNTLAYRLPQHGRFFVADADCVPCTPPTPWAKNRQFADVVARSGTALFVSVDPAARTRAIDADLRRSIRLALDGGVPGGIEPIDQDVPTPQRWDGADGSVTYDW